MKRTVVVLVFVLAQCTLFSQEKDSIPRKKITISRIVEPPKIDGILDDAAWVGAAIASDFIERMPNNGRPIPDSLKTEVKIVYDDNGIYFGASLKDPDPSQILTELTERDDIGNDDFFFILLNGYNDRQQSLQFIVTAAGGQYDAKMTSENEDASWNAVWYSAVNIVDDGWVAEVYIPYSEIRFPKKNVQEWGLQIEREFRRARTRYSWSHVDNTKGYYSIYDGEVYGIENVETPTRLSFQPYISTYVNNYDGDGEVTVNGGMDVKYGINDAFTLDMVLIPDFGQTPFDNAVLNLSAIEVQYAEQRQFFTEGTELFNIGDLFYSRRVGGSPSGRVALNENEEIVEYPGRVDLINAMKVSGRTDKGLGIGFFNAVTENTYATVKNTETDEARKVKIEPVTNYNVLVLDQRFGGNSSVSFVNTSTLRDGSFRDANATALAANITNKKNTMRYWAGLEGSWIREEGTRFGTEASAGLSKINGKHRLSAEVKLRTRDYDINDLGYSNYANQVNYHGYYGYRLLQPKGFLNNMYLNFNLIHTRRLAPDLFNEAIFNFNSNFTTKGFFVFGGGFEATPFGKKDIYEPRVEGRYFNLPGYYDIWGWISTDYRKPVALETSIDWYKYAEAGRGRLQLDFSPRYRVSDKFTVSLASNASFSQKEQGFTTRNGDDIVMGQRDRNTIINSLKGKFIFNPQISLSLAFRHYYSEVEYDRFYNLQQDGGLEPVNLENTFDTTYNTWNVDLRFSWWFAPGSQVTVLYRNAIESYVNTSNQDFSENFNTLFDQPQLNSLSVRVSYYLNYNRMKNWFSLKAKKNNTPHIPKNGADRFGRLAVDL